MLIQKIALTAKMTEERLLYLADTASKRYKIYEIEKRGGGTRTIAHPSRELKALQRWISKVIFKRLPVHEAATAYRKSSGIKFNAENHRTSNFTTRYDFSNFFPSFRQEFIEKFIASSVEKHGLNLDNDDVKFIGNVICRHGRLTIGAPSSPIITNAMMFDFDAAIYSFCEQKGLIYTRYADDIFISSHEPDMLQGLEKAILQAKRDTPHLSLRLNKQKTAYLSRKYARRITGVIITPDHKLSIGRDRKREIKALVHQWLDGRLPMEDVHRMRGLLAFTHDIEPAFELSLRAKYGEKPIDEILRNPKLGFPSPNVEDHFLK